MKRLLGWLAAAALCATGAAGRAAAPETRPDGRGIGTAESHGPSGEAQRQAGTSGTGIAYHGGPLLLGSPRLYFIWYGNWSGNTAQAILPAFAGSLGGSPYYNINTTYYDGAGARVSNALSYGGAAADAYSQGSVLSDGGVEAVVSGALAAGRLPVDAGGVYFVLTSRDVSESSGFCTKYCAWHAHAAMAGSDIKYGFIGDGDRCPSACEAQTVSPNGNAGADAMASTIAHEFEESVTDPDLNAWYNRRGQENADLCAWTFGQTSTLPSGAKYNMTLGGSPYLIQQNWVDAGGGSCALAYP